MNLEEFKKLDLRDQWIELHVRLYSMTGFTEDLREIEAMVEVARCKHSRIEVFHQAGKYIAVDVVSGDNYTPTYDVPQYARSIDAASELMFDGCDYTIKYNKDGSGGATCNWKATDNHDDDAFNHVFIQEPMTMEDSLPKTPQLAFLALLVRQHRASLSG